MLNDQKDNKGIIRKSHYTSILQFKFNYKNLCQGKLCQVTRKCDSILKSINNMKSNNSL
jgi:hypothetical protein